MTKPSFSANLKIIRGVTKNPEKYTLESITELIKVVDAWVENMPEILPNGLFTADRKLILLGQLNKLQFIRLEKESKL